VVADAARGGTQRNDLGVPRGIVLGDARVAGGGEQLVVAHDDGAHGHLAALTGLDGRGECGGHPTAVARRSARPPRRTIRCYFFSSVPAGAVFVPPAGGVAGAAA